jgi:hypothetical protein
MVMKGFGLRGACAALVCAVVIAWANRGAAQLNAETLSERVTSPGLGGGVKSTLAYSTGNVDVLNLGGEVMGYFATPHPDAAKDAERFWFRDRVLAYGSAALGRAQGEQVANDGYVHLRYTRMQWLRLGGEVFGQAQYDKFRLLSRRLVAGAGARVVFVNTNVFVGWFGTGHMEEFERRNIAPENRPPMGPDAVNVVNHRWANYATLLVTLRPGLLSLVNTVYAQPRWDAFSDIQVLAESHLQIAIQEHLLITSDLSIRYDSRPPRTVEPLDVRVGNGITATF